MSTFQTSSSTKSNKGVYHGDWNIKIKVQDQTFYIHKYVVAEFEGLKDIIAELESQGRHSIRLPGNPVDFENTFQLLYSTSYNQLEYGMDTLASVLRLATKFNHQELRAFAMQNIKLEALPRKDLVQLTLEIDCSDWRDKALTYLSSHPDRIEPEEAEILGMELVVEVASRRERKIGPSQPTVVPSSRLSYPELTERKSATRAQENRGEAWASFLSRTRNKAREISIAGRSEKQGNAQSGGSAAARGFRLAAGYA